MSCDGSEESVISVARTPGERNETIPVCGCFMPAAIQFLLFLCLHELVNAGHCKLQVWRLLDLVFTVNCILASCRTALVSRINYPRNAHKSFTSMRLQRDCSGRLALQERHKLSESLMGSIGHPGLSDLRYKGPGWHCICS